MFDKAKAILELKKIQSALAKEIVEIEQGAVKIKISGDQKIKSISLDPDQIDIGNLGRLEKQIESAVSQAITKSQQVAAEKMQSVAGGLGLPGL